MNFLRRQLLYFSIGCLVCGASCAQYQADPGYLGLLSLVNTATAPTAWWNTGWNNRILITFNNLESTENLALVPVLITLNSARIDYAATQDLGQDLRFIDADNTTELKYEIELWDETGTSIVWVRVPQVDAGSSTDLIWLYYNNSTASGQQSSANTTAVWSNDYLAVWHLNGDGADSTGNYSMTDNGTGNTVGMVGNGRSFAGGAYLEFAGLLGTLQELSISAWANLTTNGVDGAEVVSMGDYSLIRLDSSGTNTRGVFRRTANWEATNDPTTYTGTGWHYFAYSYSDLANAQALYTDQTQTMTSAFTHSIDWTVALGTVTRIGSHADASGDFNFTGQIDEARISGTARSQSWIRAQYRSMSGAFQNYGAAESLN